MTDSLQSCVFCRIVSGSEPAHVVFADEHVVAFLDLRPLFRGHVLVVPRDHVVTLPELPTDALAPYFGAVQRIAAVLPAALSAQGSFVAMNNIVSQSVPHLHTHVVPRNKGDGLRGFFWPRTKYLSEDDARSVAAQVRTLIYPSG
jgi:histidine triad (HIT) family protein